MRLFEQWKIYNIFVIYIPRASASDVSIFPHSYILHIGNNFLVISADVSTDLCVDLFLKAVYDYCIVITSTKEVI